MIEDHAIASAKKTECFESTASKKRKIRAASPAKRKEPSPDLTSEDAFQTQSPPAKKKKGASSCNKKDEEKRSRRFRQHPPSSYLERLERATTQRWAQNDRQSIGAHYGFRMFVIDRTRGGTQETPEETIDLAGTTGNVYRITICQSPSCTCPDSLKGNQCKHIVYVYFSTQRRIWIHC